MIRIGYQPGRLTVRGHAAYAPHGQDLVCAAVSALTYALIGYLEERKDAFKRLEIRLKAGNVEILWEGGPQEAFTVTVTGYAQLMEHFPGCVTFDHIPDMGWLTGTDRGKGA